jgi:simple sugar transport system permease protein
VSDLVSYGFATLRTATPLLYAAAGGCICERGGIVNIALEGLLLGGAFASISAAALTGSATAGVVAAVLAGVALAGIHAAVTIRWKVDQIVSGVALNLLAAGLTRFCLQLQFGSASNSGSIVGAAVPVFLVERGGIDVLSVGALIAPLFAYVLLEHTRFGLRLRAAGEHPEAATTLGVSVARVRTAGVLASGALAALGGVWLAYGQHQFVTDMTSGRGFVALAAVIAGGWRPLRALVACLLFGALEALTFRLEGHPSFRDFHELVEVLPYVATLIVLATAVLRSRAPAALGKA